MYIVEPGGKYQGVLGRGSYFFGVVERRVLISLLLVFVVSHFTAIENTLQKMSSFQKDTRVTEI